MITVPLALFIASGALELIFFGLMAVKTIRNPKKVRIMLLFFSLLSLPASVVNILAFSGVISYHWNSFSYLLSTIFMLTLHLILNLDIGKKLRAEGVNWRHPCVVTGIIALFGSMCCLTIQIVVLLVRNDTFPTRPAFITGVCLAIISDGATYLYSFSALIHFKSSRFHEGQSETTALGIWYLFIQFIWYSLFGALYVWFFCNTWDFFATLLVFDYFLRFILCLIFTWTPPNFVIQYMSGKFFSEISHRGGSIHTAGGNDEEEDGFDKDTMFTLQDVSNEKDA